MALPFAPAVIGPLAAGNSVGCRTENAMRWGIPAVVRMSGVQNQLLPAAFVRLVRRHQVVTGANKGVGFHVARQLQDANMWEVSMSCKVRLRLCKLTVHCIPKSEFGSVLNP